MIGARAKLRRHGRHGSALVMALIAVSVVSMLAAAYLRVATSLTRTQLAEVENARAFYLAEAGLNEAYHALRMGRTGTIGSMAAPARHGQGLLWVEAVERADATVRLESTALCGRGRATLAIVVEPVAVPLGFFSDEGFVADNVLLVDGYDSSEATYAATVGGLEQQLMPGGEDDKLLKARENLAKALVQREVLLAEGKSTKQVDLAIASLQEKIALYAGEAVESLETLEEPAQTALLEELLQGPITHTYDGGLLGSNGDIALAGSGADASEVFGDAVPGAGSQVLSGPDAFVTGSTEPRSDLVELPPVEVPVVEALPPLLHDSPIPLVVPPGNTGYASLTVAADSELVVRGPCKLVLGALTLEPGADLFLDTSGGDVALYVTGPVDMQAGSTVATSGERPDELSLQVAEVTSTDGTPPVKLDATAAFHGTIYSPDTAVRVGSAFEVFGGMVAKSLVLAPGVRLHFDNAGFEGSPLPKFLSWRIVEVPAAVKGLRGDPFEALGVERSALEPLADAHDLTGVWLTVSYIDVLGNVLEYRGLEADFDWHLVAELLQTERSSDEPSEETAPEPPATGIRPGVQEGLDLRPLGSNATVDSMIMDVLMSESPVSPEEMAAVEALDPKMPNNLMKKLRAAQ